MLDQKKDILKSILISYCNPRNDIRWIPGELYFPYAATQGQIEAYLYNDVSILYEIYCCDLYHGYVISITEINQTVKIIKTPESYFKFGIFFGFIAIWISISAIGVDSLSGFVFAFPLLFAIIFSIIGVARSRKLMENLKQSSVRIDFPDELTELLTAVSRSVDGRRRWLTAASMTGASAAGQIGGALAGKITEKLIEQIVSETIDKTANKHLKNYTVTTINKKLSDGSQY